ncbi:MAG: 2-dehydro-3-deoxygalactonokinase [Beijerinckiaceae bacterium]
MNAHSVTRHSPIIIDWGTSSFRAYRFDDTGAMIAQHRADAGIATVNHGAFEAVLTREIGAWLGEGADLYFSGMITSRNGWVETPYAPVPATLADLSRHAVEKTAPDGERMKFLPGVAVTKPAPDVMRGEEIQVFGTIGPDETATVVLPGTHSKWVQAERGAIAGFRTFLTGELFAVLKAHTIVGRLIPTGDQPFDEAAFLAGVEAARRPDTLGLLNDVFTTRAGALLGAFGVETIADRLSGMLIGAEIRAGLTMHRGGRLVLVGEEALTQRYALAFSLFGQSADIGPPHAAVAGFRRLAAL